MVNVIVSATCNKYNPEAVYLIIVPYLEYIHCRGAVLLIDRVID